MNAPHTTKAGDARPVHAPMGFKEFVGLVAGLMALNAMAMDSMLPALRDISLSLGVTDENDRQGVLTAYLVGFGIGQLLIGSVSDRFGRRTVLLTGLAFYVLSGFACMAAPTFGALLLARFVQGMASAVPRVITTSIVRDCYGGPRMASVMSLAMMVFMAVPVLAPSIGQLVVLFAPWRAVFGMLTLFGLVMAAWAYGRLPETLPPSMRRSIAPRELLATLGDVLTTRQTMGYALAGGAMFGAMFGLLVSAQQIFTEIFGLGAFFPLAFAAVALTMSFSSFINSRLVGRLGMRAISHGAVVAFTLIALVMAVLARLGWLGFVPFMLLLGGIMFLVGMVFSNFNSLAMEPQARRAGTASSLFGSITTFVAVTIGYVTGQSFDGTLVPLSTGYLCCGLATLAIIAVTERGRLFGRSPGG